MMPTADNLPVITDKMLPAESKENETALSAATAKLRELAADGNIEAMRALDKIQRDNRYNYLINQLDDDEFTP